MNITTSQFHMMAKLLDATSLRQRVIGENIANVNTPGYQRQEVQFEQQLVRLIEGSNKPLGDRELGDVRPRVTTTKNLPSRADGNNVNVETEVGQLTKNEILYETYSQILATQLGMMRTAITGNQ